MNLCADGHEEVCYEDKKCPVCVAKKEFNDLEYDLEDQLLDLRVELESLTKEKEHLQDELNSYLL